MRCQLRGGGGRGTEYRGYSLWRLHENLPQDQMGREIGCDQSTEDQAGALGKDLKLDIETKVALNSDRDGLAIGYSVQYGVRRVNSFADSRPDT
jgi:hypothetical protein